ncbi:DNA polymerase III subunit gamma/tau [Mycetocola zhadangensis]|uniref:DNA polymerase III subunit gamma/tau n=1 Tax=Mycetocola zhadangensis TaxID=1164595 RepID=A0A3L7JBC1_9MICO|nr:DNA polymerase III subunit gamma/tau [Mycetocola zhadangensis]RLQ85792.1 DNA polymerase III subunit gamma/tau [Mycetocola zhadangensis]GGE85858.1 hypothetical protein GCM10011313_05380 [Mycetocola zhadangensis]
MPRDSDDEALTWAGDDEPAQTSASEPTASATAPRPKVAPGWRVVGKPGTPTVTGDAQPRVQMGSVALVVHGILGGVYLLYIIGWLIAAQRDSATPTDIIGGVMYTVGLWFAVLAPALWFGTVLWLTRGAVSSRVRLIALAVGVVVLIPVPFLVGGAA